MEEYIIQTAKLSEWQKWLNQWRHSYNIDIISAQFIAGVLNDGVLEVAICLKRTPKEDKC